MLITKIIYSSLMIMIVATLLFSCKKNSDKVAPIHYLNRIAQDSVFRRSGIWCSISDGAGYHFTVSPIHDSIIFINDTLAKWTGLGGNPWSYSKTYFKDPFNLVIAGWNPTIMKYDSIVIPCGSSVSGDTFCLYHWTTDNNVFPELFIKKNF